MRIFFTRFPFTSAHGGAENQTMWLAAGLRHNGHEVSFLGSCPVLLKTFSAAGFQATRLEIGPPPVTKWGAVSFLWRRKRMMKLLMKAFADSALPDAVFMLSLSEKILLTPWLTSKGVKVFWIEHDRVGAWLTKNPWLTELRRAALNATVVCVSKLSASIYEQLGFDPSGIVAIPNGVPPASLTTHSSLLTTHLRLGCIARLSPEKGIDVLLRAISAVPEVTLDIVGTGPEEGYLRTLITEDTARMGGSRIRILSRVPDLDAFYASCDAVVLPSSDHDPFGLTAAEAMMRGLPTVVTDACGIAESLTDGDDALIAKAGDPVSLGGKISMLLDRDRRIHLSENGLKTAKKAFSVERMAEAYEKLLHGSRDHAVIAPTPSTVL